MTIERVNTHAARHTILGWFVGLAYYNWFAHHPPHLAFWKHILLATVGMFGASLVIGGSAAAIAGAATLVIYKNVEARTDFYAWAAYIAPVLAFFAAGYVIHCLS